METNRWGVSQKCNKEYNQAERLRRSIYWGYMAWNRLGCVSQLGITPLIKNGSNSKCK